jgi:ribosomal protein S7
MHIAYDHSCAYLFALMSADREALEKLVGILTKDGKKSRARRLLLDAMHIIQQQLAQGKGSA